MNCGNLVRLDAVAPHHGEESSGGDSLIVADNSAATSVAGGGGDYEGKGEGKISRATVKIPLGKPSATERCS